MKGFKAALKRILPRRLSFAVVHALYTIRRGIHRWRYSGGEYYCPICDSRISRYSVRGGIASCPICESSERHRLDWLFLRNMTDLFDCTPKRMLHVAPELFFATRFKRIENLGYVSIDIEDPRAMNTMDITDITFPDHHFDAIYCSHVLEHIPDDRKAIAELYRVCKPEGWALLQVPITSPCTVEDLAITEPEERRRAFGQEDHVRLCGLDYVERMSAAGFDVRVFSANDVASWENLDRMGVLRKDRYVFYCRKPT